MSLIFSDTQMKNLTKDALLLPLVISDPVNGTGLVQQKQNAVDTKSNFLITDGQNKVFTDNGILSQENYHTELKLLNSELRTNYVDANIDLGARGLAPHYSQTWPNITPIIGDAIHGLPVSTYVGQDELELINLVLGNIGTLLNGFNFGTTNEQVGIITDTSFSIISPSTHDLAVGQKFVLDNGTNALIGIITSIDPEVTVIPTSPETVNFTHLAGVLGSTLSGVVNVKNALSFTNAERGHQVTPPPILLTIESALENDVNSWLLNLSTQISANQNNGDTESSRKLNNQTRLNENTGIKNIIDVWKLVVVIDANGKYTDATLPQFQTDIIARQALVPVHAIQITNDLGTLSQAPDGVVTGSGLYLDLLALSSTRMSKGGGSLASFYNSDLPILFFEDKIQNANNQLVNYTNTFAISKIVSDTIIGQTIFTLDNATEFNIGDTVKILDNNSIVYTRLVTGKAFNDVEVDSGVPNILISSNLARLVRQK